jgi:HK97 family phage major capsid protein
MSQTVAEMLTGLKDTMTKELGGLKETVTGIQTQQKSLADKMQTIEKTAVYPPGATPGEILGSPTGGAPGARIGEDPLSSRGFSYLKLIGAMTGKIKPEDAKVELDMHNRLSKVLGKSQIYKPDSSASVVAPLDPSMFPYEDMDDKFRIEMKSIIGAGSRHDDRDHMAWTLCKSYGWGMTKAMSWLDETLGGGLVKPAEQMEVIELLRNQEALARAGARTMPLPPQGRMLFPRIVSPTTAAGVSENTTIASSTLGTGTLELSPKKIGALVTLPNELIRYASPAAEAILREDMTKTLALQVDFYGLEGNGGNNIPLGIINTPGITTFTSSVTGVDGDTIVPQDVYLMISGVQEKNAEFTGWIMRPQTLMRYHARRWDSVTAGDQAGGFVFEITRGAGMAPEVSLGGHRVTTSTNVSRTRTKGAASNLTYILGGNFSDVIIGMFGAIEFASTDKGAEFALDQTTVRALITADVALRRGASMILEDSLVF